MDIVEKQRPFFVAIYTTEYNIRSLGDILDNMNRRQAHALALVALNTLHGAIGISYKKKKILKEIKPFLRALSAEGDSLNEKKRIIVTHPRETYVLVHNLFKVLDELIWRVAKTETA